MRAGRGQVGHGTPIQHYTAERAETKGSHVDISSGYILVMAAVLHASGFTELMLVPFYSLLAAKYVRVQRESKTFRFVSSKNTFAFNVSEWNT